MIIEYDELQNIYKYYITNQFSIWYINHNIFMCILYTYTSYSSNF